MMHGMTLQLGIDAQINEGRRRILGKPQLNGSNLALLEILVMIGDRERESNPSSLAYRYVPDEVYSTTTSLKLIKADVRQLVATGQLPQAFIESYNAQSKVFRDGAKDFDPSDYR